VLTVGRRSMSGVAKTAGASGEMVAWRPKIQVTRHLSPFENEIIAPPSKWLNYQKSAFIENAPDWLPGLIFFVGVTYLGDSLHHQWSREHAMHGSSEE
jgi:hypothetical protein